MVTVPDHLLLSAGVRVPVESDFAMVSSAVCFRRNANPHYTCVFSSLLPVNRLLQHVVYLCLVIAVVVLHFSLRAVAGSHQQVSHRLARESRQQQF